ncbi:major facilitator superfamily transporter [Pseudomonas sp. M47T1]|uniref:MFS transporter n=1 Tax=Pseudomonas sp. M47T1 TaxID=1179778 RepID=UPI0002607284|nr:MFS transporter [Pseudomonas sp. M47T1]EIK96141.1 major facilitator superfamily transporter [Pseudomonas sp. M47T1]
MTATPSALAAAPTSTAPLLRAAGVVTAVFILSNAATPLYGHWQQQMGFGAGTLATIFTCYILGLLGTLLVAGRLSDHFGAKALLIPALMLAMIAAVLFQLATSVALLMAARLLTGVAVGIIVSAGMANVVNQAAHSQKRQASLLASVAMVLGAGTGPLLAGIMAQYSHHPLTVVFNLELLLLALALWAVLALPRQRPATAALKLRLPSVPRENIGHVLRGVAFFGPGITATSFVLSLGPSLFAAFAHVGSPLIAGGTAFAMFMVGVAVQFAVQRLAVTRIFLISGLATVLAMATLWLAVGQSSVPWLVLSALLAGAGQGTGQLGGLSLIALHVPANRRAEANGVFNMGGYVPAGALPMVAGHLIDLHGLATGVTVLAAIIAGLAVAALITVQRLQR